MTAPTPEIIISTVADYFHVDKADLIGRNRKSEFIKPRHIAIYLCYKNTSLTLKTIGEYFKGDRAIFKDHASILHAVNSVRNQMSIYANYERQVNEIIDIIDNKPEYVLESEYEVFMQNDCF